MDIARFAWLVTVVLTGTAAGAMVGHTVLLGRFLNWMFESGRTEVFKDTYPLFILTIVVTTAFNAYLYLSGQVTALSLLAVAFQWAFVGVFFGTGFAKVEAELFKNGNTSPVLVNTFVKRNIPLCALSAVLLLASFVCLALMRC